ncbi:hypothetical protein MNEG_12582 [Monoraphidium neglectum]|uniref:Peptidase C1A papain C-terminal domain-containing protein n=1 Tax=Monoraphidium neglectum TaxID=145388 RepID=A0A0D2MKD3_9CHLO|nr:hypothetical protein MNEG_12582 [Monoraphidium neglectum]KIY95380.1 hypothetical protein MNEG_12582 [Monoraphidium neglectum]|eukprot:XP_013894400.1 hypothetical protein MNEG_12582 [Monoraphidium neglectum]
MSSSGTAPHPDDGQGLLPDESLLGADNNPARNLDAAYSSAGRQWSAAVTWQRALKASPKAACVGTSKDSLCSSSVGAGVALRLLRLKQPAGGVIAGNSEKLATLMFATSPAAYSSLEPRDVPYRIISPPRSQGECQTCTAFVAVAGAEAAAASALGQDVANIGQLSPQDLYYCGDERTSCDTGASLKATLGQLEKRPNLKLEKCMPYQQPDLQGDVTRNSLCTTKCTDTSPLISKGRFDFVPIAQLWKAQQHIRRHGAVATRFDVYSDFKPFFANPKNAGAVYRPSPGIKPDIAHAILLVGYDNVNQFWIARNSWGPGFAQNGNFRVAFGVAGVLTPGDTFGVVFFPGPGAPTRPPPKLLPAPNLPKGCSYYVVGGGLQVTRLGHAVWGQ